MLEFIDTGVEQKDYEMSDVVTSFMNQNFSFGKEKIHYLSNKTVLFPKEGKHGVVYDYSPNGKSLFIQSLHSSFDNHQPFLISPDSIWYIISYEIATHIRLNQEKYRELFTTATEKDKMDVRADWLIYGAENNDWGAAIDLFRQPIAEKVPQITREMLMIDFSTSTDQTKLAMLAIFMDMLQHYYSFTVHTKCGIPKIRVTGMAEDWHKIFTRVGQIHDMFPELKSYLNKLLDIIGNILGWVTYEGTQSFGDFWNSIYKYRSMSGGDIITGWINNLFAYDYSQKTPILKTNYESCRLEHIPTHISKVPFIWDYLGTDINMNLVSGFLGNSFVDGYMTPELGFGICEILQ